MSGTSLLGFGFNVFHTLDLASGVTQSIVVADNNTVTSPPDQPTVNNSYAFTSREQVTSHFASSVEAEASGFGFDGEFSAKYGRDSESSIDTVYGLYNILSPVAITKLADMGVDNYATPFASDPDVVGIPTTFSADTAEDFYRLFRRYGTHFVSEITTGGRLNAYTTSKVTSVTNQTTAEASVKLEYEALFGSASAQATADWKNITSDYSQNREMSYETIGGNPAALVGFVPEVGEIENTQIGTWLATVPSNPEIIDYRIERISTLFNGPIGDEVDKAFSAYMMAMIRVEAWQLYAPAPIGVPAQAIPLASTIALPGRPLVQQPAFSFGPAPTTPDEVQWLWLLLLDPNNLDTAPLGKQGKSYYFSDGAAAQINTDISAALAQVPNPLVIMCIEGNTYQPTWNPVTGLLVPEQLQALLETCGGYDLQAQFTAPQNHAVLSIIGLSGDSEPALVTAAAVDSVENYSTPGRTVAQFLNASLTLVDQDGVVMSPVNA